MRLANRIVHAPMHSNLGDSEGGVSDRLLAYVDSQSKGGAGLVYVEHAAVEAPRGNNSPITLNVSHERFIAGLSELADVVHANGAKVTVQIDHAGRQSNLKSTRGQELISSSNVPWLPSGSVPRAMTIPEIKEMVVRFADAAARVQLAGFDAVTIHAGHGYLISSFLSPFANVRGDEYGGSVHNRMRFLLEIATACRERVGRGYPIIVRLNGADHLPGGLTNDDVITIAQRLEEAGIDALDMTSGTRESGQWQFPTLYMDRGLQIPDVRAVRAAVDMPLIAIGKISTPELAASIIRDDIADLVSFGRELLADPEMPRKIRAGQDADIRPCIYCNDCMVRLRTFQGVACAVNPRLGREKRSGTHRSETGRKVVIVGGGPAGLTAAAWARRRGHLVTVYERSNVLGGKLRASALLPYREEQRRWLHYLLREHERLEIATMLGTTFDEKEARASRADVLIVAAGSDAVATEHGILLMDLLNDPEAAGARVAVSDASQEGCEAAFMLAAMDRKVSLVGPLFAPNAEVAVRNSLLARLANSSVERLEGYAIAACERGRLIAEDRSGETITIDFDTLVVPTNFTPAAPVPEAVSRCFSETIVIGDATGSHGFMDAVASGAAAALRI
jgi:2,4-dienoyl-CoA reductase-like NADH-dependent reductase (Old Yellow Enzyme family)/thioredoxin reductase